MNDQGTGGQEIPQKFGTWDIYETVKNGNAYKAWCYWDEDGNRLEGLQEIQGFKYYFDKDNEIKLGKRGTIVDKHYIMGDYTAGSPGMESGIISMKTGSRSLERKPSRERNMILERMDLWTLPKWNFRRSRLWRSIIPRKRPL